MVVRLVSCVGEGYSHGHIKDFVEKAKKGEPIIPLDDGLAPKSFVHVRDAAEAIATLAGRSNQWISRELVTVAAGSWSWRDTLAMMGISAERWEEKRAGWRGDPVGLRVDSTWHCKRSVGEGVREALHSLGWNS
jgi:nucleoside-diphosphate-sugar epimerase